MTKASLSVILITKNESANIRACLESLAWADEIIVVDSGSTDDTAELARQFGARVYVHDWPGFGAQKNRALGYATCDWVFSIDADERVTPELRAELQQAMREAEADGYYCPRLSQFCGRFIRHSGWYPDYDVRVFRRELATWGGADPHERILISGKARRLKHPLQHFSYRDIADHLERINHFTNVSSGELEAQGRRWSAMDNVCRPPFRFFRSYVWKRGFLEGFPGFFVAATAAIYVFLKYAKLRERELKEQNGSGSG